MSDRDLLQHPVSSTSPDRRSRIALVVLLLAEAMNLLDATVTTVVAPRIRADVGGSATDAVWIVAAYTLPFAVLLVLGGRLGDIAGRRRVFLVGVLGFVVASLGCAVAPTMVALLGARAAQGAAAALVIPQTIGLIKALFTGPALPRALGWIGPVMGVTAVIGPVAGGVVTHLDLAGMSWRAVFLLNVPLGALVLAAAVPSLREDRAERRPTLDLAGLVLVAVAVGGAVLAALEGPESGWPVWTWLSGVAATLAAAALVAHVRRQARTRRDPIVEPGLFGDRGFPAALVTSLLYFSVATGITLVVSVFVQSGLGLGVTTASLTVLPFSTGLGVASYVAGRWLVPRHGAGLMRWGLVLVVAGLLVAVAGLLTNAGRAGDQYPWLLSVGLAIAGAGGGTTTVPFFTAALSLVRPEETGSAAGLLNAVQQLGSTLGVVGLGTVSTAIEPAARGLAAALALGAALCVLAFMTCTALVRSVRASRTAC